MLEKQLLIEEYVNKGKPMHQIAKENNIAIGTVYNYLKLYGVTSRPRITQETKEKISKALKGKPSKIKGRKLSKETKLKISEAHKGKFKKTSEYGGHTKKHKNGYILVLCPNHPYATKNGYVLEHILAYEKFNNCIVDRTKYVVHHIDGNKTNNTKDNLMLMTKSEHASYHSKQRAKRKD